MIDQLRRDFPFDTHNAAVGMIGVGIEPRYTSIFDGRDGGAVRGAERAVAAKSLDLKKTHLFVACDRKAHSDLAAQNAI